jgi:hypothetical protein
LYSAAGPAYWSVFTASAPIAFDASLITALAVWALPAPVTATIKAAVIKHFFPIRPDSKARRDEI